MKKCDLLVIEDDPKIRDLILETLEPLALQIMTEADGTAGEARAREYLPAVIVLDLGLPGQSGIDLLRKIRPWFKGSVLVVTAWEDEAYKLEAFELGADDYVQKPFSTKELLARVRVAIKRVSQPKGADAASALLKVGDLVIDRTEHRVTVGDQVASLTQTEFKFLSILAEEEGRLVSQKRLLQEVWGPNHSEDTHYLRILVSKLRKKLVVCGSGVVITTESGLGYRIRSE